MSDDKLELGDQDLEQTTGAFSPASSARGNINNSRGQIVGKSARGVITYYPCPKCQKPMHAGFFDWYCDPCNYKEFKPKSAVWSGTRDELKAASL